MTAITPQKDSELLVGAAKDPSYANFAGLARKLKLPRFTGDEDPPEDSFRLGVLGSATMNHISSYLGVLCWTRSLPTCIYEADFNQYGQEILSPDSRVYRFRPDVTILAVEAAELLGEVLNCPLSLSDEDRLSRTDQACRQLIGLVETLAAQSGATVLVHNLAVPLPLPLGSLDNRVSAGATELVGRFNRQLTERFASSKQVFVIEYESVLGWVGRRQAQDPKLQHLAQMAIGPEAVPDLCNAYLPYLLRLSGRGRKCIAVDLDNTLWGGIVGEDGLAGIQLGPTAPGSCFLEFQQALLNCYHRGIILAVNSRNNREDVVEVFEKHPHMLLKQEHFAAMVINWSDKAANLRQIAQQLNIGLDAIVFIDDDPMNRDWVGSSLPEVLTVEMPADPSQYARTLLGLPDVQTIALTAEDRKRGRMYYQERQRTQLHEQTQSLDDFLAQLQMEVLITDADQMAIPRISQLTQRTNQFNMTTKRYSESQVADMAAAGDHMVLYLSLKDRLGDSGIVGVAIVRKDPETWEIDTLLMSCRILGRQAENALMAELTRRAADGGAKQLVAQFIPTKKNVVARDYYQKMGLKKVSEEANGRTIWAYNLSEGPMPWPDGVKRLTGEPA